MKNFSVKQLIQKANPVEFYLMTADSMTVMATIGEIFDTIKAEKGAEIAPFLAMQTGNGVISLGPYISESIIIAVLEWLLIERRQVQYATDYLKVIDACRYELGLTKVADWVEDNLVGDGNSIKGNGVTMRKTLHATN